MPDGWFFDAAERWRDPDRPEMVAYRPAIWLRWMKQILEAGGTYSFEEALGSTYISKVGGVTNQMLTQISGDPGCQRFPGDRLDDSLSGLNTNQKNSVRNKILSLGYTQAEWDAAFPGDLGQYTARQVLQFALARRRQPRYDQPTDSIVWDGKQETPMPVGTVDA